MALPSSRHESQLHCPRSIRARIGICLIVSLLLPVPFVCSQEPLVSREYAIKAGVIGVLTKCVIWPAHRTPSPESPLTIGILGDDPFGESGVNQLEQKVRDEEQRGTKIVIRRFRTAKDYEPCHILFVSSAAAGAPATEEKWEAARNVVGDAPVLLVGETPGSAQSGAAANLIFDRATNLIRLEINPDAAARANLKLSPDLLRLKLVTLVRDQPK
jgi:hypothetical protein